MAYHPQYNMYEDGIRIRLTVQYIISPNASIINRFRR